MKTRRINTEKNSTSYTFLSQIRKHIFIKNLGNNILANVVFKTKFKDYKTLDRGFKKENIEINCQVKSFSLLF